MKSIIWVVVLVFIARAILKYIRTFKEYFFQCRSNGIVCIHKENNKKNLYEDDMTVINDFILEATNELQTRCKKLGLPVKISTFHSLANQVIASSAESHHQITTGDLMFKTIKEYLINNENDRSQYLH